MAEAMLLVANPPIKTTTNETRNGKGRHFQLNACLTAFDPSPSNKPVFHPTWLRSKGTGQSAVEKDNAEGTLWTRQERCFQIP